MADHVTVVLVTRGVTEYLGPTLAALAASTRTPDRVLVVDAGGPDHADDDGTDVATLVAGSGLERPAVVRAPGARTFGDAVRTALGGDEDAATGDRDDRWLWLLHDDSAPDAGALEALLRAVEIAPSVTVAGCKQHTWGPPVRVLEVGVTTSRFGRRMTGLDSPEVDQGQHDGREDVLGVGTAGMLVRRDVWEHLGGTDPALGPYRDGLDLSRRARLAGHRVVVVPTAVVRHAQASLRWGPDGQRGRPDWDARRSAQARRAAYLHAQLSGVPVLLVPIVAVLALVSGVGRALGRVAIKEPHLVTAELAAPVAVLGRPHRIVRARRAAAATSVIRRGALRPLQVTWRDVLAQARDRRLTLAERRRRLLAPSELEVRELAAVTTRRRAVLGVVLVAAVGVSVVALGPVIARVLSGARLTGGTLPFGDAGLGELWEAVRSGWVSGGLGAPGPSDPLLSVLLPLTAVTGTVGRSAALVLLGALVLSAFGAWCAAGAATRSVGLRAWAALVWAGAPALLLALTDVRFGAVLAHVALPWVVLGVARAVGVARVDAVESGLVGARRSAEPPDDGAVADAGGDDRTDPDPDPEPGPGAALPAADAASRTAEPSLAAAAGAGLALVAVVAGAPLLLPFTLLALAGVAALSRRRRRLLWTVLPVLVVHGPLLVRLIGDGWTSGWRSLVADPGVPLAVPAGTPAWSRLLGWPVEAPAWVDLADPWATVLPWVLTGAVVLVAIVALAVPGPAGRAARAGWLVVACGLVAVVVADRVPVAAVGDRSTTVWAGPATSLVLVGVLTAALAGAAGVQTRLARHAFGWRQVLGGLVLVLSVVGPLAVLGTWSWASRAPGGTAMVTSQVPVVPAVGRHLQQAPEAARVLALTVDGEGGVAGTVLRHDGVQLTELSRTVTARTLTGPPTGTSAAAPDAADVELAEVVARVVTGTTTGVADDLATLGIGAVLVPPTADGAADAEARSALVGVADSTAGLERMTQTESGIVWRVVPSSGAVGWARVLAGGAGLEGDVLDVLPAHGDRVETLLPPADGARLLVLAERSDRGWRATLDGVPLRSVETSWRQAFELVPDGGLLVVEHTAPDGRVWLVLQGVVVLVSTLLALPVRRRRGVGA